MKKKTKKEEGGAWARQRPCGGAAPLTGYRPPLPRGKEKENKLEGEYPLDITTPIIPMRRSRGGSFPMESPPLDPGVEKAVDGFRLFGSPKQRRSGPNQQPRDTS